jgi:hypothetical protein
MRLNVARIRRVQVSAFAIGALYAATQGFAQVAPQLTSISLTSPTILTAGEDGRDDE